MESEVLYPYSFCQPQFPHPTSISLFPHQTAIQGCCLSLLIFSFTSSLMFSLNAGILASQILTTDNEEIHKKVLAYKENLKQKIVKANTDLSGHEYPFRVQ